MARVWNPGLAAKIQAALNAFPAVVSVTVSDILSAKNTR
jgi:hypothetical protein